MSRGVTVNSKNIKASYRILYSYYFLTWLFPNSPLGYALGFSYDFSSIKILYYIWSSIFYIKDPEQKSQDMPVPYSGDPIENIPDNVIEVRESHYIVFS